MELLHGILSHDIINVNPVLAWWYWLAFSLA